MINQYRGVAPSTFQVVASNMCASPRQLAHMFDATQQDVSLGLAHMLFDAMQQDVSLGLAHMFDATQQDVSLGLAHMFDATQQDVSCGGGVGWGGDDDVPCTCTHVWCYATGCFSRTCTHVWCYATGCFSRTCTHVWCYATGCFSRTCTHVWCYAKSQNQRDRNPVVTLFFPQMVDMGRKIQSEGAIDGTTPPKKYCIVLYCKIIFKQTPTIT